MFWVLGVEIRRRDFFMIIPSVSPNRHPVRDITFKTKGGFRVKRGMTARPSFFIFHSQFSIFNSKNVFCPFVFLSYMKKICEIIWFIL
jgi:hypothetical protein